LSRTLIESGLNARVSLMPGAHVRTAAVAEAQWSRPEGATLLARTLSVGPELGLDVGKRGHAELSARRGFVSGAPALSLLPTSDPAGPPRWTASGRLDVRVRESTTAGVSLDGTERVGRRTVVTGRAELKAFF